MSRITFSFPLVLCHGLQTVQFYPHHRAGLPVQFIQFVCTIASDATSPSTTAQITLDHRLVKKLNQPGANRKNSLLCPFLLKASVLSDYSPSCYPVAPQQKHGGVKHLHFVPIYWNRDVGLLPHDLQLVFVSEWTDTM